MQTCVSGWLPGEVKTCTASAGRLANKAWNQRFWWERPELNADCTSGDRTFKKPIEVHGRRVLAGRGEVEMNER